MSRFGARPYREMRLVTSQRPTDRIRWLISDCKERTPRATPEQICAHIAEEVGTTPDQGAELIREAVAQDLRRRKRRNQ